MAQTDVAGRDDGAGLGCRGKHHAQEEQGSKPERSVGGHVRIGVRHDRGMVSVFAATGAPQTGFLGKSTTRSDAGSGSPSVPVFFSQTRSSMPFVGEYSRTASSRILRALP